VVSSFLSFLFFSGHRSIPILKLSFSSSWGDPFATDKPEFSTRKFSHGVFKLHYLIDLFISLYTHKCSRAMYT
jgi:hypothetical protein